MMLLKRGGDGTVVTVLIGIAVTGLATGMALLIRRIIGIIKSNKKP